MVVCVLRKYGTGSLKSVKYSEFFCFKTKKGLFRIWKGNFLGNLERLCLIRGKFGRVQRGVQPQSASSITSQATLYSTAAKFPW